MSGATHHSTNVASQGKGCEVAVHILAILVQVANVDLHSGMILGCDKLVCVCAAQENTSC